MARHRNIRSLNFEEEYNDYYDEYSRSVEEEHCISPRTASHYLLSDHDDDAISKESRNLQKVDEENEEQAAADDDGSSDVTLIDAKTYSCLEAIQDVVGDTIPEEDIIAIIKKCSYDSEKALDLLLNRKTSAPPTKPPEESANKLKPSIITTKSNSASPTPSRNNSKNDLTRLSIGEQANRPKKPQTTTGAEPNKAESPFSTPKFAKNLKTKSAQEITEIYQRTRARREKQNINLVIVGHVDAGKSTIMGHLLSLIGIVSKRSMHKNETDARKAGKASFMYAWVLDETAEERARGITIDVGQYRFETEKRVVTILDAPGHRDFIPNMIAGATKADVAILVIDATNGEFETGFESGGQTQEHTLLLRSLGISQLAVVVNKLDNVKFDQNRYKEIVEKLGKFLKQVGFRDQNVHMVPCSGLTGDNLVHSSANASFAWYKGPTLVHIIDQFISNARPITKPFRMSINDIYKGQTSGICVAGKIDSGFVECNQKLLIRPLNEICSVKNIYSDEEVLSEAFAGDVLTLNLSISEGLELSIGNVLCDLTAPCTMASKFEARIVIFSNIEYPITKGFSVILYSVCLNEVARISKLISLIDKNNDVLKRNPRILSRNNNAIVEFTAPRPVCVEAYNDFKEYGRFIFRSGNATIGAGIVTKVIA